jgi:hypothetical protein
MRAFVLIVALAAGPALAQPAARTHCTASETVVFSCATGATRTVSLCLRPGADPAAGGLTYRFGPIGKPDMTLPAARAGAQAPEGRFESFANGGRTGFVRMRNGGTGYVVWHAELRDGPGRWTNEAGVRVEPATGREVDIRCRGPVQSSLLDMDVMQGPLAPLDGPQVRESLFP